MCETVQTNVIHRDGHRESVKRTQLCLRAINGVPCSSNTIHADSSSDEEFDEPGSILSRSTAHSDFRRSRLERQSAASSRPSTISSGRSSRPSYGSGSHVSSRSSRSSYSEWTPPDADFLFTAEARERRELALRQREKRRPTEASHDNAADGRMETRLREEGFLRARVLASARERERRKREVWLFLDRISDVARKFYAATGLRGKFKCIIDFLAGKGSGMYWVLQRVSDYESHFTARQSWWMNPSDPTPTALATLEWDCSCGRKVRGEYALSEAHTESRLVKSLPDCRIVPPSKVWPLDLTSWLIRLTLGASRGNSCFQSAKDNATFDDSQAQHQVISCDEEPHSHPSSQPGSSSTGPDQHNDASSTSSASSITRSDSSASSRSSSSCPSTPNSSISAASSSASSVASMPEPKPAFFELCVNRGDLQISLGEIQLVNCRGEQLIKGDIALIAEIRKRYDLLRRKGLFGYLYRPADIQWVRFGVQ